MVANSKKLGSREIVSPPNTPCNTVLVDTLDSDGYTDEEGDTELFEDDFQPLSLVKEKSCVLEGESSIEKNKERETQRSLEGGILSIQIEDNLTEALFRIEPVSVQLNVDISSKTQKDYLKKIFLQVEKQVIKKR